MANPIIFISNQRIKPGQQDEYFRYYQQVVEQVRAAKPGTFAHLAYGERGGPDVSIVHIFPDAEAMEKHMLGVDELAKKAFEYMEIVSFEIFGEPSQPVLDLMMKIAGSGIELRQKPLTIGGYIRI